MRRLLVIAAVVLAAAATTAAATVTGASGAAASRPDSGIRGLVRYGPTCPVVRPGRDCERPYQASITIKRAPAGTVAARVHSAADGRFSVRLAAGRYLLVPRNGKPYPRALTQLVTVRRHKFTSVTVSYDSGIR